MSKPTTSTSNSTSNSTSGSISSSASAGYIAEKLQNARQALIAKGLYLGTPDLTGKLAWDRDGKAERLVTVEAAETAAAAHKIYAADPNAPEPTAPEPAILSAVVKISEDDYWLTSCGMWKGPTEAAKLFADVKPTCMGQIPDHDVFADDFKIVLKNITEIINMGCTKGFKDRKGVLTGSKENHRLKFHHILFDVSRDLS